MIPLVNIPIDKALDLEQFRDMDYFAVQEYGLPIELMMENAGLLLAQRVAEVCPEKKLIRIGVGNGNNGGGGLVAARRLLAWGYEVWIDAFTEISRDLARMQWERALKFGAQVGAPDNPAVWVDAYLGFSQRLPLRPGLLNLIDKANASTAKKISLDIPTGFLGDSAQDYFHADQVLTLAASKKILYALPANSEIFIADLGIPGEIYTRFGSQALPFAQNNVLQLQR